MTNIYSDMIWLFFRDFPKGRVIQIYMIGKGLIRKRKKEREKTQTHALIFLAKHWTGFGEAYG